MKIRYRVAYDFPVTKRQYSDCREIKDKTPVMAKILRPWLVYDK
ncbi:MAG TPA: hypothetical protein VJ939_07470 [Bacteroidales bacterium]|nr:hypothetical protein [Bacteroidales bacterium]